MSFTNTMPFQRQAFAILENPQGINLKKHNLSKFGFVNPRFEVCFCPPRAHEAKRNFKQGMIDSWLIHNGKDLKEEFANVAINKQLKKTEHQVKEKSMDQTKDKQTKTKNYYPIQNTSTSYQQGFQRFRSQKGNTKKLTKDNYQQNVF